MDGTEKREREKEGDRGRERGEQRERVREREGEREKGKERERLCFSYLFPQVFDQEQARLESEKKLSCTTVQNLRRNYRKHLTATEGYKGKLETALARDPPKPAEQDK